MESGNSSSMQSSSGGGGGEEYDSRAADQSISAFFDHHVTSLPPPQQNHINLLQFDHNNSQIPQKYFNNNNNTFLHVNQQPDPIPQPDLGTFSATSSLPAPNNVGIIKKTKKRSRASRRAPTTVLTTDTSNFRAMVQEFTGIPSPPLFNNNSVVNTTRLNTFLGLSSSPQNAYNSNNNILVRPFAQKLLPTSPLVSGSQIQQYQNPNNSFENMSLQSLLQAQISNTTSNPRSNDHDQFGLSMLQSASATPLTTTTLASGNIATGENGSYGVSVHDHNNIDSTWLCSSSDQRT